MDWTKRYSRLLAATFVVLMSLAIVTDLVMVDIFGVRSISLRTWIAEKHHPTLITAGTLATVGVCYLVREWRTLLFFGAFAGAHLFAHW